MLYGDILVPHLLRLILCIDQCLVQILADIRLAASRYFRALIQSGIQCIFKILLLDPHLLDQPGGQRVILMHQSIHQMFLFDLLVTIIRSSLLEHIYSFDGLLCKFLYIHPANLLFLTGICITCSEIIYSTVC